MSKVFFANSGSEANDSVIKMVWYFNNAVGRPKKKKIIGRIKGYHGITLASASLTGLPANHRSFDLPLPGFIHTVTPHHYHGAEAGESEEAFATRCADELEKLILAEDPDTVAAMFAEPVMGAGGVIVPPRTYYEKIQAVCRKYDMLFVADEVICGFGRTGNYWGSQTMNIEPDILSCAKALSSSLPADQRGDGERARVPGARRGKPQDRHVRARLHLFRPPGRRRRRGRDAQDLRRDQDRGPCPRRRPASCSPSSAAASPSTRWWAKCAASA